MICMYACENYLSIRLLELEKYLSVILPISLLSTLLLIEVNHHIIIIINYLYIIDSLMHIVRRNNRHSKTLSISFPINFSF